MDFFIIIIALLLFSIGFFGAFLPIIPGPVFTYAGLLLMYFFSDIEFSANEMLIYTIITVLVFFSDYMFQLIGVKNFGGEKYSIYGTFLGIVVGLFFSPIGLFLGPFIGAFIGALMDNKSQNNAFGIAFGAMIGFICGTFLKIIYSLGVLLIVINKLLNLF